MLQPRLAACALALVLACRSGGETDSLADEVGDSTGSESTGSDSSSTDSSSTDSSSTDSTDSESTSTSTDSESTTSESTTSDSTTGDEWLAACPSVAEPQVQVMLAVPEIDEASGMVHSRSQDLLWVHNDSGDSARLFALGPDGARLTTLVLEGVLALDWEDLAIGPGPSPGDWLYAGDIGDNGKIRPWITLVRVPEPIVLPQSADPFVISDPETIQLTYPDGPHDAETLFVDPITGDLFIVSKGAQTQLFRKPAPISSGELEELPMPSFPSAFATGGDISALGDFIAVRGYGDAFGWLRAPDQSVGEAMQGAPCSLPLASEMQGETLAFHAAGTGYFTLSEGADQPLWWYAYE